jgi:hypothetical protein
MELVALKEYEILPDSEKAHVERYVQDCLNGRGEISLVSEGRESIATEALNNLYPEIYARLNDITSVRIPKKEPECVVCGRPIHPSGNWGIRYLNLTVEFCGFEHSEIVNKQLNTLAILLPALDQLFFLSRETAVLKELTRRNVWAKDRIQHLIKTNQWSNKLYSKADIPLSMIVEKHARSCPCGVVQAHSHELVTGKIWDIPNNPD